MRLPTKVKWFFCLQLYFNAGSAINNSDNISRDLNQQQALNEEKSHHEHTLGESRGKRNKRNANTPLYLNVELIIDKQFCVNYDDVKPVRDCARKTRSLINDIMSHGTIYWVDLVTPQIEVVYSYTEIWSRTEARDKAGILKTYEYPMQHQLTLVSRHL